ncbi:glycosyltransferase family 2 protein [Flavihumibacter rivuli]|uniref:glycosyltransferase family 2 protein n=1 Tax=Flavihumibacter rivuli TaxID=2838156 RepID=UPI001BDE6CF4|nr:glycosyltransferase family 2 protein [Flavihumibacter rivuli]ULQ55716.1 glycosyltransferase family 2 protein [Flavihumibacter rivuli]
MMCQVFIVIPVFNEREALKEVLQRFNDSGERYEIVVVDDGSDPKILLDELKGPVHLLRHRVNLGQGAALQTGMDYALQCGARMLVTFDSDGQHQLEDIPAVLQPLINEEADIVFGSRFMGKESNMPWLRNQTIRLAKFIQCLMTGMKMTDAHNGFRGLSAHAAAKIRLRENRMAHATEILFEVKQHRLRWKEVPVHVAYTDYSISKGQSSSAGIRILFDVMMGRLFK